MTTLAKAEGASTEARDELLSIRGLSVHYGHVSALHDISFDVGRGQILGIIGPNGAGKSTLLNAVCGSVRASSGEVRFLGRNVTRKSLHRRTRLGLARTFQTPQGSAALTLEEQLLIQLGGSIKAPAPYRRRVVDRIAATLERVELMERRRQLVGSLTLGEFRRFEIARAIVAEPKLLLVDEPCSGMTGDETRQLGELLSGVVREGVGVVLIEHNIAFVRSLAPQLLVLDAGELIAADATEQVLEMEVVKRAYLGTAA